ncbi:nicotinate-nucleotide--dimethylbenzimidazole phosphoribosyltransferase [Halococcus sediminicola]|uniref:nicotinate-nucleotide--dimethylbenzimidazole phosphoribosyltransferase n=1 Tax=Halococcus sediminicola TaxID=1264579 RepID=UPI000A8BBA59|nr:TIGR00303 family protein [Halococcus sediminicola]
MRFVLVAGTTETAHIEGISAARADPDLMAHTPSADLEIVEYGQPVQAPVIPMSPTGCPTPAVITRAVRELIEFDTLALDTGLVRPTSAPTVALEAMPGRDIRHPRPVDSAMDTFEAARQLGRSLPDDELVIGETIPGGTTTALGECAAVSPSLPENPFALKQAVVDEALAASSLSAGETADEPVKTVRHVGDPVLAAVAGLTVGATTTDTSVTLAGGTQLIAAAALARHAGVDATLSVTTTSFIADDKTVRLNELANDLSLDVTVTDPDFHRRNHSAMNPYVAGEAKEGVGMGGALALADRAGVSMADIREQVVYERENTVMFGFKFAIGESNIKRLFHRLDRGSRCHLFIG